MICVTAFDPQQEGLACSKQHFCKAEHWYTLDGLEKPFFASIIQSIWPVEPWDEDDDDDGDAGGGEK